LPLNQASRPVLSEPPFRRTQLQGFAQDRDLLPQIPI
jgi:hypothetical protein